MNFRFLFQAGLLFLLIACGGVSGGKGPGSEVGGGGFGAPVGGGGQFATGPGAGQTSNTEMPELPLAPHPDIEEDDDVPTKVESRFLGEVLSVCQSADKKKIRRELKVYSQCRWNWTNDPFTVCGRGRYFRIFNKVTKEYVDVQASEDDASFTFSFTFNAPSTSQEPEAQTKSPRRKQVLWAYNAGSTDTNVLPVTIKSPSIPGIQTDFPPSLPFETFDPKLKDLPSGIDDFNAMLAFNVLTDLGMQKFCSVLQFCADPWKFQGRGPVTFTDPGPEISDATQVCQ